jgi:hypothetical protein
VLGTLHRRGQLDAEDLLVDPADVLVIDAHIVRSGAIVLAPSITWALTRRTSPPKLAMLLIPLPRAQRWPARTESMLQRSTRSALRPEGSDYGPGPRDELDRYQGGGRTSDRTSSRPARTEASLASASPSARHQPAAQ